MRGFLGSAPTKMKKYFSEGIDCMEIAEVTATFPPYNGGVGNVAYHNARLLAERGHHVTVITQRPTSEATRPEPLPFTVRYLDPAITMGNAPLLPKLPAALQGFDLIHLHYPFIFGAEMVLFAARRYRIPVLITYHNRLVEETLIRKGLFSLYNFLIEPRIIKHAAHRISVSRDHFQSLFPGVPSAEVANGVDTALFSPVDRVEARRMLGLPGSSRIALFVGGLDIAHKFKNVPGLLRAASKLPEIQVVIVGRGELRTSLIRLAQHLNMADRTRFDDSCTNDRLPLYYSAADVTVLPSNRTESFGMVLAESMACETAVIATNLPGVRQVVRHRQNGLLVPVDDDTALLSALQWLLEHDNERLAMGREGRRNVEREYAWPVIGEKLEQACWHTVKSRMSRSLRSAGYNA